MKKLCVFLLGLALMLSCSALLALPVATVIYTILLSKWWVFLFFSEIPLLMFTWRVAKNLVKALNELED